MRFSKEKVVFHRLKITSGEGLLTFILFLRKGDSFNPSLSPCCFNKFPTSKNVSAFNRKILMHPSQSHLIISMGPVLAVLQVLVHDRSSDLLAFFIKSSYLGDFIETFASTL